MIAADAETIRSDCQTELDKVTPILEASQKLLEKISSNDINQLKSFANPPISAKVVMEGMCYAFDEDNQVKMVPKPDGKPGEKMQDFWEYSKKKLLNDKLIKRVKGFKPEDILSIPLKKIDILKVFITKEDFAEQKV